MCSIGRAHRPDPTMASVCLFFNVSKTTTTTVNVMFMQIAAVDGHCPWTHRVLTTFITSVGHSHITLSPMRVCMCVRVYLPPPPQPYVISIPLWWARLMFFSRYHLVARPRLKIPYLPVGHYHAGARTHTHIHMMLLLLLIVCVCVRSMPGNAVRF